MTVNKSYHCIHTRAFGNAVIALSSNQLSVGWMEPARADQRRIRKQVGGMEIRLQTSLTILTDDPAQGGYFAMQEVRRVITVVSTNG
ncbi:hypothetical protein KSF_020070 [Reticulibacter mediterranei]|uniref:Uncharacterized protein n=1 Tax=Reticulibacter mediterranei TaxID=2778369 RepID=A0A8J3MYE3_9CHLR|nr:hypothetical protein KSF_020070 [Reticulibacter mediterranei]